MSIEQLFYCELLEEICAIEAHWLNTLKDSKNKNNNSNIISGSLSSADLEKLSNDNQKLIAKFSLFCDLNNNGKHFFLIII